MLGSIHIWCQIFWGMFDLPTLIRYFTTYPYLVKSDEDWPTYLPSWKSNVICECSLTYFVTIRYCYQVYFWKSVIFWGCFLFFALIPLQLYHAQIWWYNHNTTFKMFKQKRLWVIIANSSFNDLIRNSYLRVWISYVRCTLVL